MKTVGKHVHLNTSEVELDVTNPRIARFLSMYEGEVTPEHIALALDTCGDDHEASGGTTVSRLKHSILTHGGIIQPILVNRQADKKLICIEGNTRLALYRQFIQEEVEGAWETIPAIVYEALDEEDIDAIRLQAHLVGPRQWDAYSKAKYLTYLRNKEGFSFSQLIAYCGGNERMVKDSIEAYVDMENHYRDILDSEDNFDTTRFSGFVELQRPGVKRAISDAGYKLTDFARWLHDRKIVRNEQVRHLADILKDKKATKVFLKENATAAIKVLDRPNLGKALQEATLSQLCRAVSHAYQDLAYTEVCHLRSEEGAEERQNIEEALADLQTLVQELSQGA
ncbi:hypothetical protein ACXR0O_13960 [Verrucomicrobiota bacterium sgz303538]